MLPPFTPVANVQDVALRRVQDAVARVLRRICAVPFLDGLLIGPLNFALGVPQVITHRLGRTPIGFWVVNLDGAAVIFRVGAPDGARLTLQSSAACSATLWVF